MIHSVAVTGKLSKSVSAHQMPYNLPTYSAHTHRFWNIHYNNKYINKLETSSSTNCIAKENPLYMEMAQLSVINITIKTLFMYI